MPWKHCDHEEVLDSDRCPSCGISKHEWTVQWDVTRTFAIKRKGKGSFLKISLLDPDGDEVAGEPYVVQLPDGKKVEGKLDDYGYAKIPCAGDGKCQINFPKLSQTAWSEVPASSGAGGQPAPSSGSQSTYAAGAHRFQLKGVLTLELEDDLSDLLPQDLKLRLVVGDDPPQEIDWSAGKVDDEDGLRVFEFRGLPEQTPCDLLAVTGDRTVSLWTQQTLDDDDALLELGDALEELASEDEGTLEDPEEGPEMPDLELEDEVLFEEEEGLDAFLEELGALS